MVTEKKDKKLFSLSNIITALLVVFAVSMFIFPEVKATVLQGLMKVGLFQPSVSSAAKTTNSGLTWNVQLSNSTGEILDGNSLKGKVVFVNSWATWCPPCIAEMPSVQGLYDKFKNNPDVVFLLVDADNNLSKSEKFMRDKNFDLPVYIAGSGLPEEWFGGTLPTTVVLDKKGNIVFDHKGVANYNTEKFKSFIEGLVKE